MSAAEVLRTITAVAAGVCGLGDRKGRIAVGYDADILAVAGNPLIEPASIHNVHAVYSRGRRVV
jgi:imidazolonepropionase-like amidohydrolase